MYSHDFSCTAYGSPLQKIDSHFDPCNTTLVTTIIQVSGSEPSNETCFTHFFWLFFSRDFSDFQIIPSFQVVCSPSPQPTRYWPTYLGRFISRPSMCKELPRRKVWLQVWLWQHVNVELWICLWWFVGRIDFSWLNRETGGKSTQAINQIPRSLTFWRH